MKFAFFVFSVVISSAAFATEADNTMEIIYSAAVAAPDSVYGEYVLDIKEAGATSDGVYLNTELDYRDQRNVSVAIDEEVIQDFIYQLGESPQLHYKGKRIRVRGEAKRVKIHLYSKGRKTSKYYYQTHILVSDTSQIDIIDEYGY